LSFPLADGFGRGCEAGRGGGNRQQTGEKCAGLGHEELLMLVLEARSCGPESHLRFCLWLEPYCAGNTIHRKNRNLAPKSVYLLVYPMLQSSAFAGLPLNWAKKVPGMKK
jgi:hypothetical protein